MAVGKFKRRLVGKSFDGWKLDEDGTPQRHRYVKGDIVECLTEVNCKVFAKSFELVSVEVDEDLDEEVKTQDPNELAREARLQAESAVAEAEE